MAIPAALIAEVGAARLADVPPATLNAAAAKAGGGVRDSVYVTRYSTVAHSSDAYGAAARWLSPGADALTCGICFSLCVQPHSCVRRGDVNTERLRSQMATMDRNMVENVTGDCTKVFEQMGALQAEIHHLEEPSRNDRQACCNNDTFVCRACLERHVRSQRVGQETCPLCRKRIWSDIFLPLLPEAMIQRCKRLLRFSCDYEECRGAKPFETPLQLAIHFRDRHQGQELQMFASTLAVLDYQRLLRLTRYPPEQRLVDSTQLLVRQAAESIMRVQRLAAQEFQPPPLPRNQHAAQRRRSRSR